MLARFPVCVTCKAEGIYRPTDEIDHLIPLAQGGPDTDDNLQGLCDEHHKAKTRLEAAVRVSNHPDWLERSTIPLTIICGPPCSGKSTLARQQAQRTDLIIDLDDILLSLDPTYRPWTGNREHLNEAILLRNRLLGSLAHSAKDHHAAAWFVVSAPTQAERDWWQDKLGGKVILLHPGTAECKDRATKRNTPGAVKGIDDWEARSREPWHRHRTRVPIDPDGWPAST